ncbi:MAG: hypothetical protein J5873_03365 [Bacteroidales bacterium]|nr:hypothetical protein [Bacteroidales bacterium]
MKRSLVFVSLLAAFAFFFRITPTQAQRIPPTTKNWGPTFITNPVFLQGFGNIHITNKESGIARDFKNSISVAGVSQTVGYQFSPAIIAGVGVGFEYWTSCRNAFVPIYADLRVNIGDAPIAPQWYLNVGYANRWYIDSKPYVSDKLGNSKTYVIHGDKSGLMAETGIGVKAQVSQEVAIVLSGIFKMQESSVKFYEGDEELTNMKPLLVNTSEHNWYTFAGIKASIIF